MREALAAAIGRFVAAHRTTSRLTQDQLAERCSVSRQTVAMIEAGTQLPSFQTLYALAAAFEVEPADLLPTRKQVR